MPPVQSRTVQKTYFQNNGAWSLYLLLAILVGILILIVLHSLTLWRVFEIRA